MEIYKPIPDTKNIIITLVESLNNNDTFTKHVKKLHTSVITRDKEKADIINSTIKNIQVFNTKRNPLILAKDIGILMGISQINYLIRKFEPSEKIIGYITKNNKTKKVIFLTKLGIYRCFFVSRSPLAHLFRTFISNLLDHMITEEPEILKKFSAIFKTENPELIERGINDLQNKLVEYETKYLEEQKKAELLELQYTEERQKRLEAEDEKTEIDIINTYNMMHIEQLKKDKKEYIHKIQDIKENVIADDAESVNLVELQILKEKYMKPMYIYLLHPKYFKKMLILKKKNASETAADVEHIADVEPTTDDDNEPEETQQNGITSDLLDYLIEDTLYETNFNEIFNKHKLHIEKDEILYFYMSFGRNIAKKDKIIAVNTQWIANKKHFGNILKALNENCETIDLYKLTLYKTSLDEISEITREEFITLEK